MNGREPRQESATVPSSPEIVAYEPGEQMALMPELEPMPQAPKPGTHPHRLLRMLAQGHALTHPDYIAATDSWRLAAHAHQLIKRGWPVLSVDIPAPSASSPGRHISVYTLAARHARLAQQVLA